MPKIAVCWRTSRDIRHHTCWTCSLRSCWTTLIVPVMGMMVVFRTQPSDLQSSFSQVFTWCLLSAGTLTSTRSAAFYSLLWIVRSGLLQMMGQSVIIGMSKSTITDWMVLIPIWMSTLGHPSRHAHRHTIGRICIPGCPCTSTLFGASSGLAFGRW